MEEERILKVSLDKAREWFKSDNSFKKEIALEVYTEEELTKVELPNSWEECEKYLCYHKVIYNILNNEDVPIRYKALIKLEILRDCYRQGWIPNWHSNNYKFCIQLYDDYIVIWTNTYSSKFLSFQSPEIRDKFFDNFKDLIEEAGDLI